jgi:hypothetical protein
MIFNYFTSVFNTKASCLSNTMRSYFADFTILTDSNIPSSKANRKKRKKWKKKCWHGLEIEKKENVYRVSLSSLELSFFLSCFFSPFCAWISFNIICMWEIFSVSGSAHSYAQHKYIYNSVGTKDKKKYRKNDDDIYIYIYFVLRMNVNINSNFNNFNIFIFRIYFFDVKELSQISWSNQGQWKSMQVEFVFFFWKFLKNLYYNLSKISRWCTWFGRFNSLTLRLEVILIVGTKSKQFFFHKILFLKKYSFSGKRRWRKRSIKIGILSK